MSQEMTQFDSAGSTQMEVLRETAGTAMASQAKALVEARFTVALRFPRNDDEVRQKLLKECKRPSFASVAIFSKPVGGKKIEGPSIRFVEAAIRMSKNIDVQTPTIYDDREKRIVRVIVIDLESNTSYTQDLMIEKTVERKKLKDGEVAISSRLNSYGETVHLVEANEDQLLVKQGALISKAIRTNGQRLLPGDLVDEAIYTARQTMKNADAQDPDAARNRVFDFFAELGVTLPDLIKWLGHEGKTLTTKELGELRAIAQSIKDGESTWREVMDAREPGKKPEGDKPAAGSKLKDAVKGAGKAAEGQGDSAPYSAQEVHDAIVNAKNADSLAEASALIDLVPKSEHTALRDLAKVAAGKFLS
ncbi:MAG: hypothetical protein ACREPQ_09820 [Rhodanobacter sp.]